MTYQQHYELHLELLNDCAWPNSRGYRLRQNLHRLTRNAVRIVLTLPLQTSYEDTTPLVTMGVEDSVYLAKLAEQAERYEGELCCTRNRCIHR